MPTDHEFALCLTHDVDRVRKRPVHAAYYAAKTRRSYHLRSLLSDEDPYFQFGDVITLEEDLGVRSAFYFLNQPHPVEKPPRTWLRPRTWIENLGSYDVTAPHMVDAIADLESGGWEVGLHGSLTSSTDRERLAHEKSVLEGVLGDSIVGGRQHHLSLEVPDTWRHYADIGLQYDASLGSSTTYGFQDGYGPKRPFDDEFVVFPLTVMEIALPNPSIRYETAWTECERLLSEAADNDAVMTVLWHLRYFNDDEFPGYRSLYRRLVERALDMGAWVGPPAELYQRRCLQDPHPSEDRCPDVASP